MKKNNMEHLASWVLRRMITSGHPDAEAAAIELKRREGPSEYDKRLNEVEAPKAHLSEQARRRVQGMEM